MSSAPYGRKSLAPAGEPASSVNRGVLLLNLGSPDDTTPEAVRVYLREFLSDPAVIQLPSFMRWFNGPLGRLISRFRCKCSAAMYQTIWTEGGSPLLSITNEQVVALQQIMPAGWRVYSAMRYGNPSIPSVLKQIEEDGVQDLAVVPMYPQYSGPTTGTAMREVYDYLRRNPHAVQVTTRLSWYNDHSYISAQAGLLRRYAGQHGLTPDNTYLLFTAHGLPVSYVRKGDPYPDQIAKSVSLVAAKAGWTCDRSSLAFQSRFGPAKWLQPYTDEVLKDLSASGELRILVCPISFTVDCLETLEELDVRYRETVEQAGTELFVCPALNTFKPFIVGLKHLVLQGCSPINAQHAAERPVEATPIESNGASAEIESLIMVGASIPGRIRDGHGPRLQHVDGETLRDLKRPACAIPDLLCSAVKAAGLKEAFIWNTCHRFELYGWMPSGADKAARERCAAILREHLAPDRSEHAAALNVLTGRDALHHLCRTAVGLNSTLPGERDVSGQLEAAHHLAERAGTADRRARMLLQRVKTMTRKVRETTNWSAYSPDYVQVALQHVADQVKFDWLNCRVTVMGGSTTSAAVLRALTDHFGVPSKQLMIVYRGHKRGNHLNVLRKAIGQGKRIRVQTYGEAVVDRAIEQSHIVVLGVDREEPILDAERLKQIRTGDQPLTIVDFNSFPSTKNLEDDPRVRLFALETIDRAVNANADAMCADTAFLEAFQACDDWILRDIESEDCLESDSSTQRDECRTRVGHSRRGEQYSDAFEQSHGKV